MMAMTRAPAPAANDSLRLGFRAALSHLRMPGCRRPCQSACHQAPSPPPSLILRVRSLASAQSTARCGFALTTLLLAIARRTGARWTLGAPNSPGRRAGTPLSLLTFTRIGNQLPNSRISRLVVLLDLPFVRISATGVRLTSSRSYPGILDLHEDLIRAYWLRNSMGRGMLYAHKRVQASSPTVHWRRSSRDHPAPLRCSPQQGYLCARLHVHTPIQVPCSLRYCSWAVQGMVVTGKFRRAPDPSCPNLTVASVHINNECAKRRSVCIPFLLLIRDLCMKLGVVILTGDFDKGAERELASSAPTDQRRISPLDAAFSHANVP